MLRNRTILKLLLAPASWRPGIGPVGAPASRNSPAGTSRQRAMGGYRAAAAAAADTKANATKGLPVMNLKYSFFLSKQ